MSPSFRTGVVIGKFCPPHLGHSLLIDTAARQAEQVTVIVCHRADQAISGQRRAEWLREMHPGVRVMLIEDVYSPDDSELWARRTVEWLGHAPDAVFTSEEYGPMYSAAMGAVHVSVDPARTRVPCSGTGIRADPFGNWEYLPPPVRAHFAMRICVIGAESTGTTTLARALAEHYETEWVPEYGREYSERHKFTDGASWRSEEFDHIAAVQCEREDEAARRCNRLLICDTDALATGVWHERYIGNRSPSVERLAARRRYSLYLVTGPDIPFVQDGYRDGEHIREWMHGRILDELRSEHREFRILSGSHETRMLAAVRAVNDTLSSVSQGSSDG